MLAGEKLEIGVPPAPAAWASGVAACAGGLTTSGTADDRGPTAVLTTLGPGNNEAKPRPKARRFSVFSSFFSGAASRVTFSAVIAVIICPRNFLFYCAYLAIHRLIYINLIY
jgi:hypothetical protein